MAENPESPDQPNWKAAIYKRLVKEGRWKPFKKDRIAIENSGVETAEAWKRAVEKYPPFGANASPEIKQAAYESGRAQAPKGGKRLDYKLDVVWVARNLHWLKEGLITPEAAPSTIAWNLAQWAITNPASFWKDVASKYLKEEDGGGEGRFDDRGEQLRLIDIFEREETEARERVAAVESGEVGAS